MALDVRRAVREHILGPYDARVLLVPDLLRKLLGSRRLYVVFRGKPDRLSFFHFFKLYLRWGDRFFLEVLARFVEGVGCRALGGRFEDALLADFGAYNSGRSLPLTEAFYLRDLTELPDSLGNALLHFVP